MVYTERRVHELINWERGRRGLGPLRWDGRVYDLAKDHAAEMADQRNLFHSPNCMIGEFSGECVWQGKGRIPYGEKLARMIVKSWMGSDQGHKELLLARGAKKAGVGIWRLRSGVYATWAFGR